jgi:predicted DNA-binding protein YlxM (UPF0122 family)
MDWIKKFQNIVKKIEERKQMYQEVMERNSLQDDLEYATPQPQVAAATI